MSPRVTFIVPCYRLAHLVGDCVGSILNQTVDDLEVLVMDDCSPDDVAGALSPFSDRRLRHIRNEPNLGHLRNYNRGIDLARGAYVWLISADDRLCRADAVERLITALDRHPRAGFAFSPAIGIGDAPGKRYGDHGPVDQVFESGVFARRMLEGNSVPAPTGVVRAACYHAGLRFPTDLPFVGDWYIWGRLALEHDVAYVADPVAEYRVHASNMTKSFIAQPPALIADEVSVRWKLKAEAEALGLDRLSAHALDVIGWDYANRVAGPIRGACPFGMTAEAFEASLDAHCRRPDDRAFIRGRVYGLVADAYCELGDRDAARIWYDRSLRQRRDRATWIKRRLLALGTLGNAARQLAGSTRAILNGPRHS